MNLAIQLLEEHGLLCRGWQFAWNNRRQAMGLCSYSRKTIYLSRYYVCLNNSPEDIRDTILHEIAHALAGPDAGHGPAWKAVCRRIGARPNACKAADMPKGKLQATCPKCNHVYHRHRRPKAGRVHWCSRPGCNRENALLIWRKTSD